jgi:hypothetical protein
MARSWECAAMADNFNRRRLLAGTAALASPVAALPALAAVSVGPHSMCDVAAEPIFTRIAEHRAAASAFDVLVIMIGPGFKGGLDARIEAEWAALDALAAVEPATDQGARAQTFYVSGLARWRLTDKEGVLEPDDLTGAAPLSPAPHTGRGALRRRVRVAGRGGDLRARPQQGAAVNPGVTPGLMRSVEKRAKSWCRKRDSNLPTPSLRILGSAIFLRLTGFSTVGEMQAEQAVSLFFAFSLDRPELP